MIAPQADHLGITIPDPDLKWSEERQHYDYGKIDWEEFWQVVKGNGPCNKERMEARVKAWEDGAWVREASMAYSEKCFDSAQQSVISNNLKIDKTQAV